MTTPATIVLGGHEIDGSQLAKLCIRYGVAELAVFGSIATGTVTPASDIDLLYVLAPGARLGFSIDQLEDELTSLLGRKVDLVARRALHRLLRERVEAQARVLYAA